MQLNNAESATAALAVLDRFIAALNQRDEAAINATLNFPHVRIASGRVAVWQSRGDYTIEGFLSRVSGDGWARSAWTRRDVIHAGADKVHIDTEFSRFRADGSLIASFTSIYIVTRVDGRWGIQARSSFAP
ncbi:MAG TPA: hypothetical protein PK264_24320 [Hyphomicrobiaceae bacterium]|nr:hypothetical protein [Hyphomicrobiaceae bacterium]